MKLLFVSSILAVAFFTPGYAHSRGCRYGRRCGGGYGESIDAASEVHATGTFTKSRGNSVVETSPYGSRGRTDYAGEGLGRGHTSARGRGTIRSNSPYGSHGVNVGSSASAFGTDFSRSRVVGNAEMNNGFSSGSAGASAHGSGYGYSNARTSAHASRYGGRYKRGLNFYNRGDAVDASAGSDAFGLFTETGSSSAVESGPYGTKGKVGHKARAHGFGASAAFSGGRVDVDTPFGGHTTHSKAAARATGNRNSYASTRGGAETMNQFSKSGSSAKSASSGYGYSSSDSKASAGQRHRHKRCITCGLDVNAHTNADGNGHWTDTYGSSSVENGPFGVHGNVRHGARGVGRGFTGARSGGAISVGDCFGCRSGVYTSGHANAYGNMHSNSQTHGNAAYHNGYSAGRQHSFAGGSGFGHSSSSTSARAGRYKRHSGTCRFPPCVPIRGIDAASRGGSTGLGTESVGDSSVFSEPGRLGGWSRHQAAGFGPGATGAESWSGIDVQDVFGGHDKVQAGGRAKAFGEQSWSNTKSGTKYLNGQSLSLGESSGRASGRGHSAARSEAVASRTRSKRDVTGELFLNGKSHTLENAQGSASVLVDDSGLSALDFTSEDGFALTSAVSSKGFGHQRGTAGGQLNARDRFGEHSLLTDEFTEAFGDGSFSQSVGKVDEWQGLSLTSSGSSARVEGDNGFSVAHSHTQSDKKSSF